MDQKADYEIKCAHTDLVDIETLVPNPRNPNQHSDEQIKFLAKIIKFQGWRDPIVVSKRSGFMTKGHGRLMAAKLNCWDKVPIDKQNYNSEAEEYADMVADNEIARLAQTNLSMIYEDVANFPELDLELLGIPNFELPTLVEPGCDEDEVPENVEPKTKLGDLYKLGNHRLLCGDSTDIQHVEKLMDGQKAELCFTSPPYADQREYNGDKELSTEHLATFIRSAFKFVNYFSVNLGYSRKNREVNPYWDDYIKEAKDCGLKFLSWNIWDKGECGSIGNQTAMFAIQHEWIFVFGLGPKDLNLTVENKNVNKLRHGSIRNADGSVTPVTNTNEKVRQFSQLKTILVQTPQKARNHGINHPAMFPVEFPEHYIEAMTQKYDGVYEPFGGSGSTLIACEKINRKCFMMELDPHYVDVIVARWEKYTGQKAELISGR